MKEDKSIKPPAWRVTLSIAMGIGWFIFIIIWLAFFAEPYSGYQNFATILVLFLVLGVSWGSWGIKQIPTEEKKVFKVKGFKSRISVSIIVPILLMLFWIIWFFFYAGDFNIYQNIAIFLVSLLALGGILGGAWASWAMKHEKEFEKFDKDKED
jgi:magnesium-transporting ATPase (P-type)